MKKETFEESSNQENTSAMNANNSEQDQSYYVNIDGEDIKVDVKNDSEYSCLLNCLEGYYIYGNGSEDDSEEVENDDSAEDEV
ncbi:MAG: hypothetical protein Q4E68_01715 [Prevotellaceae bacterium]|nr:hypothetical protein [Prevotellaceae bacterium]